MIDAVALDIDEVVAELHAPWVRWYNRVFDKQRDPLKGWAYWNEPHELQAMGFLQPMIYDTDVVQPYWWTYGLVHKLRRLEIDIVWATADRGEMAAAKWRWLKHHELAKPLDHWRVGPDKSVLHPAEALVDDAIHNVRAFRGPALLMDRPHNHHEPWERRVTPATLLDALLAL